jgi:hypothetical protein
MKNTGASSIVCFTILVLPVLLNEEYPVMSNYLTNIYQTLRDHTKYFDITGLLPLMLCTAEMMYEHELYSILLV